MEQRSTMKKFKITVETVRKRVIYISGDSDKYAVSHIIENMEEDKLNYEYDSGERISKIKCKRSYEEED